MTLKVIKFPDKNISDIPRALRALADGIENGEYSPHNLAWVMDCGDAIVDLGLMGEAPEPGATAHLLFAVAQRKLEVIA